MSPVRNFAKKYSKNSISNGVRIDAKRMHYRKFNELIHEAVDSGKKHIILDNVNGQRYIADGLSGDIKITINGVPGNNLAAFMDGPTIIVNSNGQDGIGNTMNSGQVAIHGSVGDIAGHSMRGGSVYIKGDAGYRVGIHMKSYKNLYPVIIIGGRVGDFLGEYMAGGLIVVLDLDRTTNGPIVGNYCGTGMHGGNIFIRGKVNQRFLGKEVKIAKPTEEDLSILKKYISAFCEYFDININYVFKKRFMKLYPNSTRPYGRLYAY